MVRTGLVSRSLTPSQFYDVASTSNSSESWTGAKTAETGAHQMKVADALTWEFISSKPEIDGVRLEQIMVYYHADLEEGFSCGFERRTVPDLENILHRVFNSYKLCWQLADKEQREQLVDRYFAEVKDAAAHRNQPDRHPVMQLVMNVIWLVLAGKIPEDEYNGTQYIWGAGAEFPWATEEQKA